MSLKTLGSDCFDETWCGAVPLVMIFGSWVARYRGQYGQPPADIDVLVVGDVPRAAIYEAADRAQDKLAIAVNPVLRTSEQWQSAHQQPGSDPLVQTIRHSPTVTVFPEDADDSLTPQ